MKPKVIVGLSGGVDSSVAAYLLLKQGYDVEGLFMKNWEADDSDEYCTSELDLADAQSVAALLGIPLHTANFSKDYWDNVFEHFLTEYRAGRTPNPDVLCNKEIKFKAFLDHAMNMNADYIATGHYARTNHQQLLRGRDSNKDQSYFLYAINPAALEKTLFPVGELEKTEVRRIAEQQGFLNHDKKDSTGICFIGERRFRDFLKEYILGKPGNMITPEGEVMGRHEGLMYYTIGQRQGLNIGGRSDKDQTPWYVLDKQVERNELIIGQGKDHPLLFVSEMICEDLHQFQALTFPLQCTVKVRYRQVDVPCMIEKHNDQLRVKFIEKERAVTPGQAAVFYQDDICLGGATIVRAINGTDLP